VVDSLKTVILIFCKIIHNTSTAHRGKCHLSMTVLSENRISDVQVVTLRQCRHYSRERERERG